MGSPSRRRVLRLAGAAATASIPGCARAGDLGESPPSVTPAPVPSNTGTRTGAPTTPTPNPIDIEFSVTLRSGFSERSPVRLEITARNAGDTAVTATGGPAHVLPFTDDDYAGVDPTGNPVLFLAPDDSSLTVVPKGEEPRGLAKALPASPVDGCWTLPFDWPAAWGRQSSTGSGVRLGPGESRCHRYGVYFIDECVAGTVAFANTFVLVASEPPISRNSYRARFRFVLTITGDLEVLVDAQAPVIEPLRSED